jgi:hypothetical protein
MTEDPPQETTAPEPNAPIVEAADESADSKIEMLLHDGYEPV